MKFENPQNGYVEEVSDATWLWCLLFGGFYFAFKGIWIHFVIGLGAAFLTWGISWLIYPFFARSIVVDHYRKNGWHEVSENKPTIERYATTPKRGKQSNDIAKFNSNANSPSSGQFWQTDRNLDAAKYKIHLSEKYDIKKNDLFEKYVCLDEMFDTLDEALAHADKADREAEAAYFEEQKRLSQTTVQTGVIGPLQKFSYQEFATGEVLVTHPSGAQRRFKDLTTARHSFGDLYAESQGLLVLSQDDGDKDVK